MRDQDWIPQQKYCPMGKGLYSISDFPRRPKCGTGQTPVRRLPQLLQGPQCLFLEVCSIDSDQKANSDQYRKLPNAQIKIPPVSWNFRIILSSSNVFCVQEAKSEKKIQMHHLHAYCSLNVLSRANIINTYNTRPALQTRAPEDALRREPHLLRLPPWRNLAPPCRPPILFLRDLLLYLDEQSPGRMMLKLKAAILPEIENFRAMFTGQKSFSYKCSAFPRAIPSFLHQAGDLIHNKGTGKRHPCLEATFLQKAAN
ncbi:hypothetical protein MJG53_016709 [Ovis ammon polii x Ovis aries]|uniref:Uncharacterized protein n=1 Tax=Ovis ammon polii x Ovis aries TaxID=2918886 RepID=A0ACB9U9Z9_9CETA|nr:hypothetical protein MJG53_016709 [Ovis ammon polii x Ovis aries]